MNFPWIVVFSNSFEFLFLQYLKIKLNERIYFSNAYILQVNASGRILAVGQSVIQCTSELHKSFRSIAHWYKVSWSNQQWLLIWIDLQVFFFEQSTSDIIRNGYGWCFDNGLRIKSTYEGMTSIRLHNRTMFHTFFHNIENESIDRTFGTGRCRRSC